MNKRKRLPPQQLLRERYHYDEERGHLTNRHNVSGRGGGIGSIVGYVTNKGRRQVKFNGQLYQEYNLIWMYYYGEDIPEHLEIDHIDNDRDNNRIDNLRLVTHEENQLNRRDTKRNGILWKDNPIRLQRQRERYYKNREERLAYQREYDRQRRLKKSKVE